MRNFLLSIASGILLVLIFPNFNMHLLGWMCLVPLLFAVQKKEPSKGFLYGCIAGSVFHCGLIYWITVSMTTYGGVPLFLSIILLVAFSVFLSIFTAAPVYLSCYARKYLRWEFALTLPFFWTAFEHIKSWFLTGFPWENLGYSQFQVPAIISQVFTV